MRLWEVHGGGRRMCLEDKGRVEAQGWEEHGKC